MNNRNWRHLFATAAVTGAVAFACGTFFEVKRALAGCSIAWDIYQQTCIPANADKSFADNLQTSVASYNQIPWVLYMTYTPGTSSHIVDGEPYPYVTEDIDTGLAGCEGGDGSGCGGVVSRTISGSLDSSSADGTFVFTAYDGTYVQCLDSFEVTVKRYPGTCGG